METVSTTVSSIAQVAAKAVWGENTTNGREPLSGVQGDTSKGEPFDKGNLDVPPTPDIKEDNTKEMSLTKDEFSQPTGTATATSGEHGLAKNTEFTKPTGTAAATSGEHGLAKNTEFTKPTSTAAANEPVSTKNAEVPNSTGNAAVGDSGPAKDAEFAKSTGTAAVGEPGVNGMEKRADPVTNESAALKAKNMPADTTKGQNDVRDPENPQTHPVNEPTDVDNTGDGPNEAQKLDGPGPKPLEELARENGGDAAKGTSNTSLQNGGEANGHSDKQEEPTDPNDPHAKSTGEGTGEKYIKSSGLAADGGDFDATKAGAGAEADRLMEEKGMRATKGSDAKGTSDTSVNSNGSTEKKSLKEKIKDKLHRH